MTFSTPSVVEKPTSLQSFTEEELMLKETGKRDLSKSESSLTSCIVARFAREVVQPKVREMDENEVMDKSIIDAMFENGVCKDSILDAHTEQDAYVIGHSLWALKPSLNMVAPNAPLPQQFWLSKVCVRLAFYASRYHTDLYDRVGQD